MNLKNISLKIKFVILLGPLVLMFLYYAGTYLLKLQEQSRNLGTEAEIVNAYIDISDHIGHLVKDLQSERAYTAMFLSSGGMEYQKELEEASSASLKSYDAFSKSLLDLFNSGLIQDKVTLSSIQVELDSLPFVREKVLSFDFEYAMTSVQRYTRINEKLYDVVKGMYNYTEDKKLVNDIFSYVALMRFSDAMVMEKGILFPAFSFGSFGFGQYGQFKQTENSMVQHLATFKYFADPEIKEKFNAFCVGDSYIQWKSFQKQGDMMQNEEIEVDPNQYKMAFDAVYSDVASLMDQISLIMSADTKRIQDKADSLQATFLFFLILSMVLIGVVAFITLTISKAITSPVLYMAKQMEKIAGGDMKINKIDNLGADEFGKLMTDFYKMTDKIVEIMTSLQSVSSYLVNTSREMKANANGLSVNSASQSQFSNVLVQTLTEIGSSAMNSKSGIESSNEQFIETKNAINTITSRIQIIDEIAKQTNMLSINASVEASRAGDAGRGFSVVAKEVGKLAKKSLDSAKGIKDSSNETVKLVTESSESLNALIPQIVDTAEQINMLLSEDTNQSVQRFQEAITQNAASSEELSASAELLSEQSEKLNSIVKFFKI